MSRSPIQKGRLLALWDVCDEAKTHVSFAYAHATDGRHKREAAKSFHALASAVAIVTLNEYPVALTLSAAQDVTPEVEVTLDFVYQRAAAYVTAKSFAAQTGRGHATRDAALIALCKALDVVTFYRNGPVVKEELAAADGVRS